jgi:hypothetical protein
MKIRFTDEQPMPDFTQLVDRALHQYLDTRRTVYNTLKALTQEQRDQTLRLECEDPHPDTDLTDFMSIYPKIDGDNGPRGQTAGDLRLVVYNESTPPTESLRGQVSLSAHMERSAVRATEWVTIFDRRYSEAM